MDILESILVKLNANTQLKALVTSINPFSVSGVNKMFYKFLPLTSDKAVAQARLELTAVCDSYMSSLKAIEQAKGSLITLGDEELTNRIKSVRLNGGGSLFNYDTKTYHQSAYFTIIYKELI